MKYKKKIKAVNQNFLKITFGMLGKCKHGSNCCINIQGKYLREGNKIYYAHIVFYLICPRTF
jgi:hypothetical protein